MFLDEVSKKYGEDQGNDPKILRTQVGESELWWVIYTDVWQMGLKMPDTHLVGGDWNHGILWLSRNSWEYHHPNWRSPSFFRGVGLKPPTRHRLAIVGNLMDGVPFFAILDGRYHHCSAGKATCIGVNPCWLLSEMILVAGLSPFL